MIKIYKRAVKICGQEAVSNALTDLIYSKQWIRTNNINPEITKRKVRNINDLSDWLLIYGLNPETIRSKSRKGQIVSIRRALCYYLTVLHKFSLKDTADMLGYNTHKAVMHHRDRFQELISIKDGDATSILATLINTNASQR